MSHSIDHATLRKAAEHLLTISNAGYAEQLDRELNDITDGDRDFHERAIKNGWNLTLAGNEVDRFAKHLSKITDCPLDQARGVALDLLGYAERREIALGLLSRMAADVRKLEAQTARTRFAGRRSA